MSVLRADPYSRAGGSWRSHRAGVTGGVTLFALMFASLALMVVSRLNHTWVQDMRGQLVEAMLPTLEVVSVPAIRLQQTRRKVGAYVKVLSEIDRLEEQNAQLQRWQGRALELEREIARYRKLLNARDKRTFAFVTGRVVADGRGPFARSVILNIGRREDVRNGQPVVNGDGLVGRTLTAGDTASRVLLLNDPNSRVPVFIGAGNVRGVLVGDNTATPVLKFLPQNATLTTGDEVRTSGHGGIFPPGLSIGRVAEKGAKPRVALHADTDRIDFVSVLLFARANTQDVGDVVAEARDGRDAIRSKVAERTMILPTRPRRSLRKDAGARRTVKTRQAQ